MSVFELQTGDSISAFDGGFNPEPDSGDLDTFDTTSDPSKQTNRASVWIPNQRVTINAGAAILGSSGSTENQPAANVPPEVDAGVVAQTDAHIHLHTFGTGTGKPADGKTTFPVPGRTMLRVGVPSAALQAVTQYGSTVANKIPNPIQIGTVFPSPYNTWPGYSMITEGASYQESFGSNAVISGATDLRLAGATSVLLGSPGDVHIAADAAASIADFARNDGSDSDFTSGGRWRTFQKTEHAIDTISTAVKAVLGTVAAVAAFYNIEQGRSPTPKQTGWMSADWMDYGVLGLTLAAAAGGGAAGVAVDLMSENDAGCLQLYGSHSFGAYGALFASMHAGIVNTVSSTLLTLVSGLVATSISSAGVTVVSGTGTAISGVLSASLSSQFGKVKVNAKTSTEVSSFGNVYVAGKQDVQVNSTDGWLYCHGGKGFYLGCGAGPPVDMGAGGATYIPVRGFGVRGDNSSLTLGNMGRTSMFDQAALDASPGAKGITISETQVQIQYKAMQITLDDSGVSVVGSSGQRISLG
jgi:hypothetical protein